MDYDRWVKRARDSNEAAPTKSGGVAIMLRILFALFAVIAGSLPIAAQDYPNRPITIIIPFPPGGPSDILVRLAQAKMEAELGQPLVIDNRPGATGNLGTTYAAKAAPDGYTTLIQATNIGMFPHVFSNLSYDPLKDFEIIGSMAETPSVLAVNAASPIKSLPDLIARAKAEPGSINYGSSGVGSPSQLTAELLFKLNGIKVPHVPYKGAAPAVNDLLGNFINFIAVAVTPVLPLVKDGKVRALAVTSAKRSVLLPDVPTIKELGLGDINESGRYILLAPGGTPKLIVARLSKALVLALAEPAVKDGYLTRGFEISGTTPDEVRAQIQQQYELWGPLVKEMNLKFE
jgi:tripartite-type tricarboxylate transporter receptor subunit TctC